MIANRARVSLSVPKDERAMIGLSFSSRAIAPIPCLRDGSPSPRRCRCRIGRGCKIHNLVRKENRMHVANLLKSSLVTVVLLACAVAASAQQDRFRQLKLEDTSGDQRALAERML